MWTSEDRLTKGRMVILTLPLAGIQLIWTAIMSQTAPYLASLGISASAVSLILLIGPVCGTVIQPYFGYQSDRYASPWGRRRPFIVIGTVLSIISMLLLPRSTEVMEATYFQLQKTGSHRSANKLMAVFGIVMLSAGVQPLQVGVRALTIDTCSVDDQVRGSTYSSIMTSAGSIAGYALAFIDLPNTIPWAGYTQFQCLSTLVSICLAATIAVLTCCIREKTIFTDPKLYGDKPWTKTTISSRLENLHHDLSTIPKRTWRVLRVQALTWMSWFPLLFYTTTYIGITYESERQAGAVMEAAISPTAIRVGSSSLVLFAAVSLISTFAFGQYFSRGERSDRSDLGEYLGATREEESTSTVQVRLQRVWSFSHALRAVLLIATMMTDRLWSLMLIIAALGVSWACTQIVPFALLGSELTAAPKSLPLHEQLNMDQFCSSSETLVDNEVAESKTGLMMGLQNVAISAPQILASLMGSVIFALAKMSGWGDKEAIAFFIRSGCVAAGLASWWALHI